MKMDIKLGCIADDFTGATDLANTLVRSGMRVLQTFGVPDATLDSDVDAVVIALKTRTAPVEDAVKQSLDALSWLKSNGASQIYFKYCSTFDSIYSGPRPGNIGPVTEALMNALDTSFTVATPAFPDNGRTVFKGHLFVGDVLLADSGMRTHPLTPMTDSNLVRVLQAQFSGRVGLVAHDVLAKGVDAILTRFAALRSDGVGIAILDATSNDDLLLLGAACAALPLVTAGSGLAMGLPQNFGMAPSQTSGQLPAKSGSSLIVSGSCSEATNAQVHNFLNQGFPGFKIDPLRLHEATDVAAEAVAWAVPRLGKQPVLIYSTSAANDVRKVQTGHASGAVGEMVEQCLARVAKELVGHGVGQIVVAGGETSGAVVKALDITRMQIGLQVAPGVPWCHAPGAEGKPSLHILLKSGNFGEVDIFSRAFSLLT